MIIKCSVCDVPAEECFDKFEKDDRDGRPLCGLCLDGLRAFGYDDGIVISVLHYLLSKEKNKN